MAEFKLPDVGEGLTEAELVSWKVKEGDPVEINQVICEIETAKSIVELPSPYAGTVLSLMVAEGETVEVGTPIIDVGDMVIDLSNPAASGGGEGESLVGRNKADRGPQRRARKGSASPATDAGAQAQLQLQGAFAAGGAQPLEVAPVDEPVVPASTIETPTQTPAPATARALAKPPVRKLAKDLGIDLTTVTPSGPGGTVTRDDVQAAASGLETLAGARSSTTEGAAPWARETREPVKGVRKMMASAMVGSAFTAPHVTEWVTVDVTATMELVERLRAKREFGGVKVSPLLVLARACILAMRRTPVINSTWDEAAQEVVYKGYVNLGIAAATPRGLVVPNIKDADSLSLVELAGALTDLTATAREGRTQPAEMSGGSFTITNVGVFGVDAGTPIINPGESAILCFGAVRKQPWVVGEKIVARDVTTLALSFDHRHVDGQAGSQFLADVAGILEDPGTALLF
jgi:2-oxoisovalerate dehydrogenase E2 component (dihydrolipoyl transacylase)